MEWRSEGFRVGLAPRFDGQSCQKQQQDHAENFLLLRCKVVARIEGHGIGELMS